MKVIMKTINLQTREISSSEVEMEIIKKTSKKGSVCYHHPVTGELHRMEGPAIERFNGDKEWWMNGKLHRIDGPAIECPDGSRQWWLHGVEYTEYEWRRRVDASNYQSD